MKLFLVCLLVATSQAFELFKSSDYEVTKEVELKKLVKVAEEEMYKMLVKEYPNEDKKLLQDLAREIAVLVKSEVDTVLALVEKGSDLAKKLVGNMWENLKKAAVNMVDGLESVPSDIEKFLKDLTRDLTKMEDEGVLDIYVDELFENVMDRAAFKLEYAALEKRDIWGQLNDTLQRVIGHLSGKFSDLQDFFKKSVKIGAEKLQPHLINIKKLAKDMLANVSVVSKNVAQQALEFFKPFASQLGDLWIKLVKAIDARFHMDETPY